MNDQETIQQAINSVEHPEIAASLVDLGMVRDIEFTPEGNGVSFTLVVPFFGIPETVRDYMVGSLYRAIQDAGGELQKVSLAEMTETERQTFFQKEQTLWRQ
jgi:metal-sulfur cluster biosynthetic enzyme